MPGAMFLLSYIGDIPVVGLPGCVMYNATTIFDLVIPRLVVGERVEKKDIVNFGHGGLCRGCKECTFPNCGFGK
jgi:molybdopterin biosynthesis enzyme